MKKTYNEPKEIVIELGMEDQLLQTSGTAPSGDDKLDGSGDDSDGQDMEARTQSVWGEW